MILEKLLGYGLCRIHFSNCFIHPRLPFSVVSWYKVVMGFTKYGERQGSRQLSRNIHATIEFMAKKIPTDNEDYPLNGFEINDFKDEGRYENLGYKTKIDSDNPFDKIKKITLLEYRVKYNLIDKIIPHNESLYLYPLINFSFESTENLFLWSTGSIVIFPKSNNSLEDILEYRKKSFESQFTESGESMYRELVIAKEIT